MTTIPPARMSGLASRATGQRTHYYGDDCPGGHGSHSSTEVQVVSWRHDPDGSWRYPEPPAPVSFDDGCREMTCPHHGARNRSRSEGDTP